jgi:hypothetical protein
MKKEEEDYSLYFDPNSDYHKEQRREATTLARLLRERKLNDLAPIPFRVNDLIASIYVSLESLKLDHDCKEAENALERHLEELNAIYKVINMFPKIPEDLNTLLAAKLREVGEAKQIYENIYSKLCLTKEAAQVYNELLSDLSSKLDLGTTD